MILKEKAERIEQLYKQLTPKEKMKVNPIISEILGLVKEDVNGIREKRKAIDELIADLVELRLLLSES